MLKTLLAATAALAFVFTAVPATYACGAEKTKVTKKKKDTTKPSAKRGAKSRSPKA